MITMINITGCSPQSPITLVAVSVIEHYPVITSGKNSLRVNNYSS